MEEIKNVEEVVKEVSKRRGLSKKVLVIGGAVVGLAIAGLLVLKRGKDESEDSITFVSDTAGNDFDGDHIPEE